MRSTCSPLSLFASVVQNVGPIFSPLVQLSPSSPTKPIHPFCRRYHTSTSFLTNFLLWKERESLASPGPTPPVDVSGIYCFPDAAPAPAVWWWRVRRKKMVKKWRESTESMQGSRGGKPYTERCPTKRRKRGWGWGWDVSIFREINPRS